MGATLLSAEESARLRRSSFTYDHVGSTAGTYPDGFTSVHRSRVLPADVDFESAVKRLMSWQLHLGAGLAVAASERTVVAGSVVVLHIGPRQLGIAAPCRIVYLVDDPDQRGFAYGTLPGHPESGEERFVVHRRDDGRVEVTIDAFSRPQSTLAKLAGPAAGWVQRLITGRYLRALDR